MKTFLALGLFLPVLATATAIGPTDCAGPYQGYPGGAKACIGLDNRTGTDAGRLLASANSPLYATPLTDSPVIGNLASSVFLAPGDSYHFYYQLSLSANAPESIATLFANSVLSTKGYPFDVAVRTDVVAPGFQPIAAPTVQSISAAANRGQATDLIAQFVAPAGFCNSVTNICPTVGSALMPGQTSGTFEIASGYFAGYAFGNQAFAVGNYSPRDGSQQYYAYNVLAAEPAPEPSTWLLAALGLSFLLARFIKSRKPVAAKS